MTTTARVPAHQPAGTHRPQLVLTDEQIRADPERWLTERSTGIGASEIAAVLGISPWDSPFSLYWRKKLGSRTEPNEAMEWGLRHEATILGKFAENHPNLSLTPGGLYRHPEHRWMLATPDGLAHDHPVTDREPTCSPCVPELVQVKTTSSWDGWGTPGTDQIPTYYAAQVQQEMTVLGARRCWVPVLRNGNSYREYLVGWDPADADLIVTTGARFMRQLSDGVPPSLDGTAATTTALKALHPSVVDEVVTIPQRLADQYRVRRDLLADAQAALTEVENQIRGLLGDAKTATAGGVRVAQRSVYDQTRIDTKRLKAEQPDIYAAYANTSTVNKLIPCKESPL